MIPRNTAFTPQEVVDFLHAIHTGGANAPLAELRVPLTANTGPGCYLPLAQGRLGNKLICTFEKVHVPILAKYYPRCKENVTRLNCDNAAVCQRAPLTLPKGLPLFAMQRKS